MNRLAFKLEFEVAGPHRHVSVFVGPAGGTLTLAGHLTLREEPGREEFTQLAGALLVGAAVIAGKPEVRVDAMPPRRRGEVVARVEGEQVEGAAAPAEAANG